jgi:hypothetical protein
VGVPRMREFSCGHRVPMGGPSIDRWPWADGRYDEPFGFNRAGDEHSSGSRSLTATTRKNTALPDLPGVGAMIPLRECLWVPKTRSSALEGVVACGA